MYIFKFKNFNGWQRLWLVITMAGLIFISVQALNNHNEMNYFISQSITKKEILPNGQQKVELLGNTNVFPNQATNEMIKNALKDQYTKGVRDNLSDFLSNLLRLSILSIFIYILGLSIGWVIDGFRKNKHKSTSETNN
jgi:hypothetical protein